MTLAAYTGHEALTFQDYLDLGTGKTLAAEPGRTYDVAPASGRLVPDIPQGWFTPAEAKDEDAPSEGGGASPGSGEEAGGSQARTSTPRSSR